MMMAMRPWKSFLELFIFLYFAYLQLAAAAQYDDYPSAKLSASWTNNNLSAINITKEHYSGVAMRIILLKLPNPGSRTGFACGFVYSLSTDSSFLATASVRLNPSYNVGEQSYWSVVELYWLANRNKPVHENATLELHTNGDLILRDADGYFVWSTNTSHLSVAGLQLLNTGKLVLFDDNDKTIWQSFDQPTDTLLPGQKQMAGQKLEIKGIYPQVPSEVTMQIILLNSITGFAFGFVYNQSIGSNFLGAASVGSQQPFYTGGQSYLFDVGVFWLANRNKPVHENATLELHSNGDLILRDADGTFVWSTNTSHMSVAGLQMLNTGKLVLFDDNNKTIWQSFDQPTDTLLLGQKQMARQKLEIKGIYPQVPSEVTMQIILLNSITGFAFGFVYNQSIGSNFLGAASVGSQQPFYTGGQSYLFDVGVFWLANRNKPVQENATLELHTNGDLILRDADGTFVWSTNTSHMSVAGLQMLNTGKLVLFDDNNKTIWQSFDQPTDTLLPGQKQMAGQKPEIKGIYPQIHSGVTMQIILLNSITGFAFGFVYNQSIGSNFLGAASVRLQSPFYTGGQSYWSVFEVYWLANRNKPVQENATLELHTNGDLILRDADGSFVWSTNTSHTSVAGLQMLETGKLVLLDDNNKTIWQSFDQPTDTLLPGQKQMAGQKPEIKGIYPQIPSGVTMRIILLKVPNPSSMKGFAFGFVYNQSIGSNFLGAASVMGLQLPYYTASVVEVFWLANRNKPVQENATLELHTNGDLILRDADGSFVWSTNTSHMSVASLQMLDTGNLVLYGDNNQTLWQSFDHPMDTLLQGQKLMAGQKLVSRSSSTNWTEGSFYLSVSSEGLFAFYRSNVPQMYFKFSVSGIKESEQPSYIRAVNNTLALYILSAEPSEPDALLSSPDYYPSRVNYPSHVSHAYMRLDSDGHLRFYIGGNQVDILADDLEECDYPTFCGNYGLCSYGHCTCPSGFDQNNVSDNQSGCTEINPVTCENGQLQSLSLLRDVYYFNYVDPDAADLKGIHMESCKDACLRNCSCKVAMFRFYYNISHGNCFLLSHVLSLKNEGQRRSAYHSYAFIKLPNDQELQRLSPESAPPTRAIAEVTVGTFVLLILVVGFCILCIRKKRNTDGDVEDYFDQLSGMPTRFSYEDLKLATEDFHKKLGAGGFGSVFEGTLVSGEKVAAKRLDALGQGKKEFLAEVKTLGNIHHINLVRLIGFCAEKLHRLLVYEFMCNGSLDKWIFRRIPQQPALDWQTRKTIILDIAKGLAYLHDECRQRIVHLDIKPQNILLDVNLRAKISDFGLSKLLDRNHSQVVTTMRGTPGYFAPELLSSIVTEKADVYSFGIVVMEVVCGRKNLDRSHSEGCIHLLPFFMIKAEDDCLIDLVDKDSEDMQLHGEEVVQMMRIAVWCLQNDYNGRPSMSTVVKVLEGTMEFEASLTAIIREPEEQFGGATTSELLPSILSGPR